MPKHTRELIHFENVQASTWTHVLSTDREDISSGGDGTHVSLRMFLFLKYSELSSGTTSLMFIKGKTASY